MALVHTGFDPQKHAFQFVNQFDLDFFSQVKLPLIKKAGFGILVYGLCGGMCFTALDYFSIGKVVPVITQVEDINFGLFRYLWNRQMDSLQVNTLLKLVKWMFYRDSTLARRVTKQESVELRQQIDHGEPVVLALVRVSGFANLAQNHQVIAVAYEYKSDTQDLDILLYDPNHPGQTPTLSMNLSKPSQGINLQQSTGEPLRGFFIIPYNSEMPR